MGPDVSVFSGSPLYQFTQSVWGVPVSLILLRNLFQTCGHRNATLPLSRKRNATKALRLMCKLVACKRGLTRTKPVLILAGRGQTAFIRASDTVQGLSISLGEEQLPAHKAAHKVTLTEVLQPTHTNNVQPHTVYNNSEHRWPFSPERST